MLLCYYQTIIFVGEPMSTDAQSILNKTKPMCLRYAEIEDLLSYPEIVADKPYYMALFKEQNALHNIYVNSNLLQSLLQEKLACQTELQNTKSTEDCSLLAEEIDKLSNTITTIVASLINELTETEKSSNIVLELVSDNKQSYGFCADLVDMYKKFASLAGYSLQSKVQNDADFGVKSAVFTITGAGAYTLLQYESIKHIAYFQDSKASVSVMTYHTQPLSETALSAKDIRVDIFNSSGAGGQNVNKVETAVRVTHLPTGTVVTCQDERSQLQNKERALATLTERLQAKENSAYLAEITKIKKAQRLAMGKNGVRTYKYPDGVITDTRTTSTLPLTVLRSGDIVELLQSLTLATIAH